MLTAITFDYGGTLDGEASHWLDRFVALYREHNVDRPFAAIKDAFYRADTAAYADDAVNDADLRGLMEYHVGVQLEALGIRDAALARSLVDRFVAMSEAALAASRREIAPLAERYRLGVISNFYGNVERILRDAGFSDLFAVVTDSTRLGTMKPEPRIFEHTLEALEVPAARALHVGDSFERDIIAARRIGMQAAWLAGDRKLPPDAERPEWVLRSLTELVTELAGRPPW